MAGSRNLRSGDILKLIGGAVLVIGLGVAVYVFRGSFGADGVAANANERVFVDQETGKTFNVEMTAGMKIPTKAPSGKETGYPAELCWWTKDGKIRAEPFAVVLNQIMGKDGPTFCPDCGRLVIGHNPKPAGPETTPPPTREEYEAPREPTTANDQHSEDR
ncbi:hypothetical protein BH09PLA1_BH09PLA1_06240 [soil metagenome]